MTAYNDNDLEEETPLEDEFEEDEFEDLLLEEDGGEGEGVVREGEEEEDESEEEDVHEFRQALEADEPQIGASEGFRTDRILSRFERARIKAARVVAIIHGAAMHPSVPEEIRRLGAEEVTDYELDHRLIPLCIERTVETKRGVVYQETLRLSDLDLVVPSQRLSWSMPGPSEPVAVPVEEEPVPEVEAVAPKKKTAAKTKSVAKEPTPEPVPEVEPVAPKKKTAAKTKSVAKEPTPEPVPEVEPVAPKKKTAAKTQSVAKEPTPEPEAEVEPVAPKKKTAVKKKAASDV